MAEKAVNSGESVSAVCTIVSGDSPLGITWALNGMPVEESQRISVTTTKRNSLLSIDSASPSHAGTYTCVASNAAGATTYSAELIVNGTLQGLDQPIQLKERRPIQSSFLPSFSIFPLLFLWDFLRCPPSPFPSSSFSLGTSHDNGRKRNERERKSS